MSQAWAFVMPNSKRTTHVGIVLRKPDYKERMPTASDKGSQPYRNAFRCFEMAGAKVAPLISACPWVGDMGCSCPLPKGKV